MCNMLQLRRHVIRIRAGIKESVHRSVTRPTNVTVLATITELIVNMVGLIHTGM